MSEFNGLRVIVDEAVDRGTLHVLRMPPKREEFTDDWGFEAAYSEWWASMHLWTGTVTNIEEGA